MKTKQTRLAAGVLGALGVLGLSAQAGAPKVQYEMVPHVVIPQTIEYKPTPKVPGSLPDAGITSPYAATYVPFPSYMVPFPQSFYSMNDALYPTTPNPATVVSDGEDGGSLKPGCLPRHHRADNGSGREGYGDADVDAAFKQAVLERRAASGDSPLRLASVGENGAWVEEDEMEKSAVSLAINTEEAESRSEIVQTGLFCTGPAKSAWSFSSPLFKVASVPTQSLHSGAQISQVGPKCTTGLSIPTSPYPPAPQYNVMMPQYYQLPNGMVLPVPQRNTPLKNLFRCTCHPGGNNGMPMMPMTMPQVSPSVPTPGVAPLGMMNPMMPSMMSHGMFYGTPYGMPVQTAWSQPAMPIILQVSDNGTITQLPVQMPQMSWQAAPQQAATPLPWAGAPFGMGLPLMLVAQHSNGPTLPNPQLLNPQMPGLPQALLAAANPTVGAQVLQPTRLAMANETKGEQTNVGTPAEATSPPQVDPSLLQQLQLLQQIQQLQQAQQLQQLAGAYMLTPYGNNGQAAAKQSDSGISTTELLLLILALKDDDHRRSRKGLFKRIAERRAAQQGNVESQDPIAQMMRMWCEPSYPGETAMRMPSKNAYPYGYFGASVGPQESACFGGYNNVYMGSVGYPAY